MSGMESKAPDTVEAVGESFRFTGVTDKVVVKPAVTDTSDDITDRMSALGVLGRGGGGGGGGAACSQGRIIRFSKQTFKDKGAPDVVRDARPLEKKMFEFISEKFFINEGRAVAACNISYRCTLVASNMGYGRGACSVLIGERGSGKSTLLETIADALVEHAPARTLVLHQNLKQARLLGTVTEALRAHITSNQALLGLATPPPSDLVAVELNHFMVKHKINALVFIDEVEVLFEEEKSLPILHDLYAWGNLGKDRSVGIHLTGSTISLRRLVFHKPGVDAMYKAAPLSPDLNSTKFVAETMSGFNTLDSFKAALKQWFTVDHRAFHLAIDWLESYQCKYAKTVSIAEDQCAAFLSIDDLVGELFMVSRGNLGNLLVLWKESTWLSVKEVIKHITQSHMTKQLRNVLTAVTSASLKNGGAPVDHNVVFDALDDVEQPVVVGWLHDGHDAGIFLYADSCITFRHPADRLMYAKELGLLDHGLTAVEQYSLLYPAQSGTAEINERLVGEGIAQNGLPGCGDVPPLPGGKATWSNEPHALMQGESTPGALPTFRPHTFKPDITIGDTDACWQIRKEYPDHYGADLTITCPADDESTDVEYVYRIQVKLSGLRKDLEIAIEEATNKLRIATEASEAASKASEETGKDASKTKARSKLKKAERMLDSLLSRRGESGMIGPRTTSPSEATEWADKLDRGTEKIAEAMGWEEAQVRKHVAHYVVASQALTPAAVETLESRNIVVLRDANLFRMWPKRVQTFLCHLRDIDDVRFHGTPEADGVDVEDRK